MVTRPTIARNARPTASTRSTRVPVALRSAEPWLLRLAMRGLPMNLQRLVMLFDTPRRDYGSAHNGRIPQRNLGAIVARDVAAENAPRRFPPAVTYRPGCVGAAPCPADRR